MKDIPRPYNLIVTNSYPEKQFIKVYGQELFDKLKNEAFMLDRGSCAACGHEPPENRKKDCLFYHVYEVNTKQPELSKGVTLCKMCHMTQHIESAIKKKWILLVNSIYDQNNIVRLTRGNQIYENLNSRAIVQLKKTPEEFLKEIYSGEMKFTTTLKVIFTNNFNIDDLY
jgi:hypothetical protein